MSLLLAIVLLCVGGVRGQEETSDNSEIMIEVLWAGEGNYPQIIDEILSTTDAALEPGYSFNIRNVEAMTLVGEQADLMLVVNEISTQDTTLFQILTRPNFLETTSPVLLTDTGYSFEVASSPSPKQTDLAVNSLLVASYYSVAQCDLMTKYLELIEPQNQSDETASSNQMLNVIFLGELSFMHGNCEVFAGGYQSAINHFTNATNRLSEFDIDRLNLPVPATVNLAWTYLQVGDQNQAFSLIDELLEQQDTTTAYNYVLVKRSQLYALAFRFDEAIADMDAAIELDPNNLTLYLERGQRLLLLYEWDRALADYNHALELDPDYADTFYYRGILYASAPEGIDALAEAIADFQHYLELVPNGAHAEDAQRYLTQIQSQLDSLEATPSTRGN